MRQTIEAELAVVCLLHDDSRYLLHDRIKGDWKGFTLPGGHVEGQESIVEAVIREMKEETGYTIMDPKLRGIKQSPLYENDPERGRFLLFLFEATQFEGELTSGEEGSMYWIDQKDLDTIQPGAELWDMLDIILKDMYSELYYTADKQGLKKHIY